MLQRPCKKRSALTLTMQQPWDLAGRALAEKRQFPEAIYRFEKAIRHRPNFAPHLYDFALTLASAANSIARRKPPRRLQKPTPTWRNPMPC